MKIKSVRIRNFRSIKEQTVELGDYTCFVGPNGSGKSNVLNALNVFFGESEIPGLDTRMRGDAELIVAPKPSVCVANDTDTERKCEHVQHTRRDTEAIGSW